MSIFRFSSVAEISGTGTQPFYSKSRDWRIPNSRLQINCKFGISLSYGLTQYRICCDGGGVGCCSMTSAQTGNLQERFSGSRKHTEKIALFRARLTYQRRPVGTRDPGSSCGGG